MIVVNVDVVVDRASVRLTLLDKAEELYLKYRKTESDADYDEFADFITDDVASELDFYIDRVTEA
jgi:hypothetical protein